MRPSDVAGRRVHLAVAAVVALVVVGVTAGGWSLARGDRAGDAGRSARCADVPGDLRDVATGHPPAEAVPGTDLRQVVLQEDGGELTIGFVADEPVPADAEALPAGVEPPIQWVVWLMDGADVAYHLRAILRADGWELLRDDLRRDPVVAAEAPVIEGRLLRWSVPLGGLPDLPAEFGWVALTTHGSPSVQDVCPDAANDSLDLDVQLRFPDPG